MRSLSISQQLAASKALKEPVKSVRKGRLHNCKFVRVNGQGYYSPYTDTLHYTEKCRCGSSRFRSQRKIEDA